MQKEKTGNKKNSMYLRKHGKNKTGRESIVYSSHIWGR
jgi:hypothetical protein